LKNQSIVDIAIQLYGNVDAVPELLILNPVTLGGASVGFVQQLPLDCDLAEAIMSGTLLNYDETSPLRNDIVLQARGDEPLCTVTDNPLILELPPPPPPPPYVYHPDTLLYLDRVEDDPGAPWQDYISVAESIILDRFVRDLHGESNTDYSTEDIWNKLIAVYPVMGNIANTQNINLVDVLRLSWNGSVAHIANAFSTDATSAYGDTGYADGIDTSQDKISMGIVLSNYVHSPAVPGYPNQYMGATAGGNMLVIRNIFDKYEAYITTAAGAVASAITYQPNDYLHVEGDAVQQRLFLGSTHTVIASKPFIAGTQSGSNIWIGKSAARGVQADINLAYIGEDLGDAQRKSLMNSVNYFLFKKGVRASFTAIV
jgi:hypothetical protein